VGLYLYELRRGDEVVATGQLSREPPFEVGDPVEIAGYDGIIREVAPSLSVGEFRLVVQFPRDLENEPSLDQ
jgi:hypothetical protein